MHFRTFAAYLGLGVTYSSLGFAKPVANPVIDIIPRQTVSPGGPPCGQNNGKQLLELIITLSSRLLSFKNKGTLRNKKRCLGHVPKEESIVLLFA